MLNYSMTMIENNNLLAIKAAIRQLLSNILRNMDLYVGNESYIRSRRRFISISDKLLKPYKHHLGYSFEADNADARFRIETALLCLLTEITQKHLELLGYQIRGNWPINKNNEVFGWLKFPDELSEEVIEIAQLLSKISEPELALSEICGDILSDAGNSVIGEFYTPLNMANHLVALAGVTPQDLLNGKQAVDPACGAGIILLRLFCQAARFAKGKINTKELILDFAHF